MRILLSLTRLLTSIGVLGLAGCGDLEMCGNDIAAEYPSPNHNVKVVVFERDCGATTPFTTQASILMIDQQLPNESGNAFIGSDDGRAPMTKHNTMARFEVKWVDDQHVLIRYDEKGFAKTTTPRVVNGISVSYEAIR